MAEWRLRSIGEVADIVGGGTPSTKVAENFDGEIPWITPKDLAGYERREIGHGSRNISQAGLASSSARLLPEQAVLLSTRAPIGYVAISARPLSTNQGFRSLVLRDGHVPEFFYYLLKSSTEVLESHASGSTFRELSGSALKQIEFRIPPPDEQALIAEVLVALDDKVENARRIAKTLEEIIATLFKARLVDFVDHEDFVESDIGPVPDGWSAVPIADLAEYINGKAFTKFGNGRGRMVIRIAELRSGPSGSTVYTDHDADPAFLAQPGDLLFAWSGSLGVYRWYREEALINQHIFKVIPAGYPAWLVFQALTHVMPHFRGIAADKATTMGHIKRSHLTEYAVAVPPPDLLARYDAELSPLFDRALQARKEAEVVARLRDELLPRLVSGQIRVPAAAGGREQR